MNDDIEPLEAELWFRRIEMIGAGKLGPVEHALRHAGHLLQLTPRALQSQVALRIDADAFEAILQAGDLDHAARCLVGEPLGLSVEAGRGGDGITATVSCSVLRRPTQGTGQTVAEAIIVAWSRCLLALRYALRVDHVAKPPGDVNSWEGP